MWRLFIIDDAQLVFPYPHVKVHANELYGTIVASKKDVLSQTIKNTYTVASLLATWMSTIDFLHSKTHDHIIYKTCFNTYKFIDNAS